MLSDIAQEHSYYQKCQVAALSGRCAGAVSARVGDTSARDSQAPSCACTRIPDVSVRPAAIINSTENYRVFYKQCRMLVLLHGFLGCRLWSKNTQTDRLMVSNCRPPWTCAITKQLQVYTCSWRLAILPVSKGKGKTERKQNGI